jgi:hypothetical protein
MADEDYEIVPQKEVKKLKDEIELLKGEQKNSPVGAIAGSLERLTDTLERLFEIFNIAATDIEQQKIDEKSFEEKIEPIIRKMNELEEQNRDIAEGILALADLIKRQPAQPKFKPAPKPAIPPTFNEMPEMPEAPEFEEPPQELPPMPPPPPKAPGFAERFK